VRAAVENGADAIYFGLERFNARMRAHNFTQADLPALMGFLHRRGVRGYVTFNTLVFANELAEAEDYIRTIVAAGVDAAIVQDVGICRMIRAVSPDFPIHCSTQMTITSAAGVEFARELGAELVVLARENTLQEIGAIQAATRAAPLPLEVFVHGALCVAYSGQCLTSESLGGRSANRGECAQACRLPYELISDGQPVPLGDRRYLLSPQDLAGLELLPQLVEVGVASLKIEGRLKSPEYVASITRVYRAALDRVLGAAGAASNTAGRPARAGAHGPAMDPARYELEMSFSRGLHTGWFAGIDNQQLVHARFGTKRGVFLGEVADVGAESAALRLHAPLKPGDGVVFDAGRPEEREEGGRVYQVEAEPRSPGVVRLKFGRGDIDWHRVRVGQLVWKTNDPALDRDVRTSFTDGRVHHQRPLQAEVHGRAGTPLTLVLNDGAGHVVRRDSGVLLQAAANQPLTPERLRDQVGRLGGTAFRLDAVDWHIEGTVILPVSELNRLRREAIAELEQLRARPRRWTTQEPTAPAFAVRERAEPAPTAPAELIAVIRLPEQLDAAWQAGVHTIYAEFENPKRYRDAVARFRQLQAAAPVPTAGSIWVAPPRIFKPGEEWILQQVRSSDADGYLVRNYDHLRFFARDRRRGDFALNVANPVTAEYFLQRYGLERVTASYDLNAEQLEALLRGAPPAWFDLTIHQHMPMFHMEHCVFCAFLSSGKDYRDCGRPCDVHRVALRDRVGADLPVKADAGCRNTVFNNRAQTGAEYVSRLLQLGARAFRVEFVNEPADEVRTTLGRYGRLLRGEISGTELWRELKLVNQLGVTRGQMETRAVTLPRKS
jgi:putative protease